MNVDAITVSIASIPPRGATLLPRAIASVGAQWRSAAAISVAVDVDREGAPPTKQRASTPCERRGSRFSMTTTSSYRTT